MKFFILLSLALTSSSAWSAEARGLKPQDVYVADSNKTDAYISDGLLVGGDRAIDNVIMLGLRHSSVKGRPYERVVLDLEGNRSGEPAAIDRPPYYQVAMEPELNRMVVTVWGQPKIGFDPKKVVSELKKSKAIKKVELYPPLESDRWTFALNLERNQSVEVFELTHPVRVIFDIKK